ncbi:unnamed protein product [Caenorhabditis bovis]|uniref:Uncharacterized protein n=1 Tax=Caenorhabditis bovis TaxID=2654633 RepID=A0A8S1E9T8_9PELO|nr:unnamed protein product [Caenorhabditis bovis]
MADQRCLIFTSGYFCYVKRWIRDDANGERYKLISIDILRMASTRLPPIEDEPILKFFYFGPPRSNSASAARRSWHHREEMLVIHESSRPRPYSYSFTGTPIGELAPRPPPLVLPARCRTTAPLKTNKKKKKSKMKALQKFKVLNCFLACFHCV